MPKQDNTFQIRIESILGGHSPTTHFATPDQFRASYGIDPGSPINNTNGSIYGTKVSGLLVPTLPLSFSTTPTGSPLWMSGARGSSVVYVYDSVGSAYTTSGIASDITGLSDGGCLSSSSGNGMSYHDNYIYFAKNTDIARYGPLDGTPAFDGSYWVTTLGKTALNNVTYPYHGAIRGVFSKYPNHFLHRHSDGRLYIADVVNNQGTIHFIQTTKTTVEGDTDNGSTYNKLQVGYGLWPTAIESYGSNLAIAFYEGDIAHSSVGLRSKTTRGKVAFWDTTSQNVNQITWVEFPDSFITAMKNVNGVLYIFSTIAPNSYGFKVSRFVGGYTFEEVYSSEEGISPWPGGIDGVGDRLLFGSNTIIPESRGCIYSLGLVKNGLSKGIFAPFTAPTSTDVGVTALTLHGGQINSYGSQSTDYPLFGWTDFATTKGVGGFVGGAWGGEKSMWWSQLYRIGQPFKITKIRIPLAQAVAANMIVTPKIYTDDGNGTTYTLTTINNTNYPNSERNIIYRLQNTTGQHNFWLELKWTSPVVSQSSVCTVGLPITIEYELLDD